MARGDHLVVQRKKGLYAHHGVDCGDGTVIHFTGEPGKAKIDARVEQTSMADFLKGGTSSVHLYGTCADVDLTMERAHSKIGSSQYNVGLNNCEHFAVWCKTGKKISEQVRQASALAAHGGVAVTAAAGAGTAVAATAVAGTAGGAATMSGLATLGGAVGGGAALGPVVIGAGPALLAVALTHHALRDDERLTDEQRAARKRGRRASVAGAGAGAAGGFAAISAAGTVSGLSAAGITSGLAAIGGAGGMAAGVAVVAAGPAVAAAAVGFGVYKVSRRVREVRTQRAACRQHEASGS